MEKIIVNIKGARGSGKSTILEIVRRALLDSGYLRVAVEDQFHEHRRLINVTDAELTKRVNRSGTQVILREEATAREPEQAEAKPAAPETTQPKHESLRIVDAGGYHIELFGTRRDLSALQNLLTTSNLGAPAKENGDLIESEVFVLGWHEGPRDAERFYGLYYAGNTEDGRLTSTPKIEDAKWFPSMQEAEKFARVTLNSSSRSGIWIARGEVVSMKMHGHVMRRVVEQQLADILTNILKSAHGPQGGH